MYSSDLETASPIGQVPDSPKYRLDVEAAASSGSTSFQEQSSHSWWALARTVTAFFFHCSVFNWLLLLAVPPS